MFHILGVKAYKFYYNNLTPTKIKKSNMCVFCACYMYSDCGQIIKLNYESWQQWHVMEN
jgi:hypothetical protein